MSTMLSRPRHSAFRFSYDTTTTTEEMYEQQQTAQSTHGLSPSNPPVLIVLVPSEGPAKNPVWQHLLWLATNAQPSERPSGAVDVRVLEASEDQIGRPGDAIASAGPWPSLWNDPQSEEHRERGVFVVSHHRQTLFSEEVELRTATVPRLRPHITLDERSLSREND